MFDICFFYIIEIKIYCYLYKFNFVDFDKYYRFVVRYIK